MTTLYASTSSPFARKARIVVHEQGMGNDVEVVIASPFGSGVEVDRLTAANPLNKIPTLVLRSGLAVYDSRVICEYLASLSPTASLIPATGPTRLDCQIRMALADGILDCAFNLVMEQRRPQSQQSADWCERWEQNIRRALARAGELCEPEFDLGTVGLICAVDYLAFRLADRNLVPPPLLTAFQPFRDRPSIQETLPSD